MSKWEGVIGCPCCWEIAGNGILRDKQSLRCGCDGMISVSDDGDIRVILAERVCPKSAPCWRDGEWRWRMLRTPTGDGLSGFVRSVRR